MLRVLWLDDKISLVKLEPIRTYLQEADLGGMGQYRGRGVKRVT